eukprot:1971734-Pyramimonas_sp.AAC.1
MGFVWWAHLVAAAGEGGGLPGEGPEEVHQHLGQQVAGLNLVQRRAILQNHSKHAALTCGARKQQFPAERHAPQEDTGGRGPSPTGYP